MFLQLVQALCVLLISFLVYLNRVIFIVVFVVKEVKIFPGKTQSCVAKVITLSMGDGSWIICTSLLQMHVYNYDTQNDKFVIGMLQ